MSDDANETFIDVIRRARETGAAPSQGVRVVPMAPPPRLNTHALAVQAGQDLAAEMAQGRPRRAEPEGETVIDAEDDQA